MQPTRPERPAIRSALLLALAFIGVAVTSWDADDGRTWSRLAVLVVGLGVCFVYAVAPRRKASASTGRSLVSTIGAALGIVIVLAWLVLLAQRWLN
jgi:uncharacterized membrane protein YccC